MTEHDAKQSRLISYEDLYTVLWDTANDLVTSLKETETIAERLTDPDQILETQMIAASMATTIITVKTIMARLQHRENAQTNIERTFTDVWNRAASELSKNSK